MRIFVWIVLILGISVVWGQTYNYSLPSSGKSEDIYGLILEGESEVLMPNISLTMPDGNWTYPYHYFPIYAQNQTVSGTFLGSTLQEGSVARVELARLNTSSFIDILRELAGPVALEEMEIVRALPISLNSTGDAHFALPGLPPGLYTLTIANLSNLMVMSALPILVVEDNISIDAPDMLSPGDFFEVKIQALNGSENASRKYGAALISKKDYGTARLSMDGNWSNKSLISTVSIGDESVRLRGEPSISQGLIEDIFPILPQDSAFALDESSGIKSEIFLITDTAWEPGEYILTCGIYSRHGLAAIKQKCIELMP